MDNMKKFLSSPAFSAVSMLIAVALLLFASIGGARSALEIFSENYQARMEMHDIGVTLVENDKEVSWRNYSGEGIVDNPDLNSDEKSNWIMSPGLKSVGYDDLLKHIPEKDFKLGQVYDEVLKVKNTGTINQYVRVSIYKYWLDEKGNPVKKDTNLSPDKIRLHPDDAHVGEGKDWVIDEEASTKERTVLYYTKLLKCESNGGPVETEPITDTLTIDEDVARTVSKKIETTTGDNGTKYTTITTTYSYDGYKFCVAAQVDAIQEHHAADAAESAWGRKVVINNGSLSLN